MKYNELRRKGLCVKCKKDSGGKVYCSECKEEINKSGRERRHKRWGEFLPKNRENARERAERYIKEGKCMHCGKPIGQGGKRNMCARCVESQRKGKEKYKQKLRDIVFAHYGNVCACCGENNKLFLTLDHTENDGNEHRKKKRTPGRNYTGYTLYADLVKDHFETEYKLQILCFNCNCGRSRNGGVCPHKGGDSEHIHTS